MREKILVVAKNLLYDFLTNELKHDLVTNNYLFFRSGKEYDKIISFITENQVEGDRDTIENDDSFKQRIGYSIIRKRVKICCNKHNISYFTTKRINQKEVRLNTKYSLGIGGHINYQEDIFSGILREINEEIGFMFPDGKTVEVTESNSNHKLIPLGMINYDQNDVGRVHLGINYIVEVNPSLKVFIKETDKMSGRFVNIKPLEKYYPNMETWSQVVYNNF